MNDSKLKNGEIGSTSVDLFENENKVISSSDKAADLRNHKVNVDLIIEILTKEETDLLKNDDEKSKELLDNKIKKIIRQLKLDQSSEDIISKLKAHIFGYGILEPYIKDETINNIYVNRHDDIWIQKGLKLYEVEESFENEEEVFNFIKIMQSNLGGELNRDKATATLDDPLRNLRIICVIEPIAQNGSVIMIRKHQNIDENLNLKKLLEYEMLSKMEASFLISELEDGKNIIFSGKGNSGKTTLLRALVNHLSREKRVQVMEESAELKLLKANVIAYLVRRGSRGKTIGMAELIELGLKSSIDLFIFGETRGEEALALYDAAFSGHQVLTTLHTSDPSEVPERLLINMKKSGTNIPSEILMSMVQKSIDYIVQMKDLKVESISKVSKDGISIINIGEADKLDLHTYTTASS